MPGSTGRNLPSAISQVQLQASEKLRKPRKANDVIAAVLHIVAAIVVLGQDALGATERP